MKVGEMMGTSSKASHRLDSLAGAIAAFEGIREAYTVLVGPLSCKSYLTYTTDLQAPLIYSTESSDCLNKSPFNQRRIACTYVDDRDFIYGTEKNLVKALHLLETKRCGLLGVINHSGTSLIGEDLGRIVRGSNLKPKTTIMDSTGFTGTYAEGFKTATIKILETVVKVNSKKLPKSVNIVGPTIFHYNWANDISELKRMLALLGVKVVSVICADVSLANLERASQAELNLVIQEEYGAAIGFFFEKEFGIPHLDLNILAPFGLGPTETWLRAVADYFEISSQSVDLESKRVRMKCYPVLARTSPLGRGLRGSTFGVFGDSSQVAPLVAFFYEYLGMYPALIGLNEVGPNNYEAIKRYVRVNSLDTSIMVCPDQYEIMDCLNERAPRFVFGSSVEKYVSRMLNVKQPCFIPISFPYHEKALLTTRPLMGFNGVLTFVEDVVNSSESLLMTEK